MFSSSCLRFLRVWSCTCICTIEEDEDGDQEFVWNPECPVAGHSIAVVSVDFSPDGKQFVSGSDDTLVKIWDTETGAEVSSFVGVR